MQLIKVKIPQESSKDTRDYKEGLDDIGSDSRLPNTDQGAGQAANQTGQATSALGAMGVPKNERI